MERVFTRINTVHAFRSGPLGPYLKKFAEDSNQQGYARESIQVQLRAISRFGRWLKRRRITLRKFQLTDAQVYLRQNGAVRRGDPRTLQRFLELLAAQSAIVMPQVRKKTKVGVFADEFAEHLKHERGLAPRTIKYYRGFVARFLGWRFGKNGDHTSSGAHSWWRFGRVCTRGSRQALCRKCKDDNGLLALIPEVLRTSRCSRKRYLRSNSKSPLLLACRHSQVLGTRSSETCPGQLRPSDSDGTQRLCHPAVAIPAWAARLRSGFS